MQLVSPSLLCPAHQPQCADHLNVRQRAGVPGLGQAYHYDPEGTHQLRYNAACFKLKG
jgi:hypothetical protein